MTKAERIFRATRQACREHIKNWGIEYNPDGSAVGFNRLVTEELVCTRTVNAVQKLLEKEKKTLELNKYFGIDVTEKTLILNMVESTIKNAAKNLEEFKQELAAIMTEA